MPPLMQSGKIDIFAFIGSSKAADSLIKQHPSPHRLKYALGLDAKNLGVITEDADLDVAAKECVVGSTSFNGQRCTAIKLMLVHQSVADAFLPKFQAELAKLKAGLPWDKVDLTPMPEANKSEYIQSLVDDATAKGAKLVAGGEIRNSTLMTPAVLFPVNKDMRVWHEEQFGPAIPIGTYESFEDIYEYYKTTIFGQQAAVFSKNTDAIAPLLDFLELQVGRVNVNTQCSRGPDVYPFSGRKSSALGTLSVTEALRGFSTESVLAAKQNATNDEILKSACSNEPGRKSS
jgi:glyceraldehyde-3-phosphate dehydrogenase (NADP+)